MPNERVPLANQRTFWAGALCGAAVVWMTDRLLLRPKPAKRRLGVVGAKAKVLHIPLKRDQAGGDPATLAPERSRLRPDFERRGGAPGGANPPEVHEVPGHSGQQIDHSDAARPVRSNALPHPEATGDAQR